MTFVTSINLKTFLLLYTIDKEKYFDIEKSSIFLKCINYFDEK